MTRYRFSTRSLMIATLVAGFDAAILIQASKLGPGIEFTLFIGSVLLALHLLFPSYLAAAARLNEAPPDRQAGSLLYLGCLVVVIMAIMVPVIVVILLRAKL
jgi:hypothetical protein